MNSAALDHSAESIALRLYRRELPKWKGSERPQEDARKAVARKLGLLPGTIENLCRGRLKGVRKFVDDALQAGLLRQIEHELAALTHEREVLLRKGARLDAREMAEVDASLAKVRALLSEAAR